MNLTKTLLLGYLTSFYPSVSDAWALPGAKSLLPQRSRHTARRCSLEDALVNVIETAAAAQTGEHLETQVHLKGLLGCMKLSPVALTEWGRSTRPMAMRLRSGGEWYIDLHVLQPGCSLTMSDAGIGSSILLCCLTGNAIIQQGGEVVSILTESACYDLGGGCEAPHNCSVTIPKEKLLNLSSNLTVLLEAGWCLNTHAASSRFRCRPSAVRVGDLPPGALNVLLNKKSAQQQPTPSLKVNDVSSPRLDKQPISQEAAAPVSGPFTPMAPSWSSSSKFQSLFDSLAGVEIELEEIRKRVVLPLLTPKEVLLDLGVLPPAGLILHGPPGCGKSMMAMVLASHLCGPKNQPIVVDALDVKPLAPLLQGLAWRSGAKPSDGPEEDSTALQVLIIENLDQLPSAECNQLLLKLDRRLTASRLPRSTAPPPLPPPPPCLLVGLTSRLDCMKPDLLRPGRFDVLVELKKPTTLSGRAEIFKLHCKEMRQSGRLKLHSSNSDSAYGQWLLSLASQTDGFSGAMIAGVVRAAAVLSLERAHDTETSKRGSSAESCVAALKNCQVTAGDFERALVDIARSWLHHDSSEDNSTREAEGSKISRKTPPAARVPTQFVVSKAKMDAEKVVENEVSSSALLGAVLPEIKTKMEATGWQHWSEDAIKRVALKRDEEARVELRPPKETATETSSNEARTSMRSPSPESRHDSKDEGGNDALKRAAVKSALSDVKERMSSTGWFHWSSSSIQKVVEKRKLSVVESQDGSAMPIEKTESMFRQEASRGLGEEEEINMSSFAKAVQQARKEHRQGG